MKPAFLFLVVFLFAASSFAQDSGNHGGIGGFPSLQVESPKLEALRFAERSDRILDWLAQNADRLVTDAIGGQELIAKLRSVQARVKTSSFPLWARLWKDADENYRNDIVFAALLDAAGIEHRTAEQVGMMKSLSDLERAGFDEAIPEETRDSILWRFMRVRGL